MFCLQSRGPTPEGESLHQEGSKVFYSAFTYKGHTYKFPVKPDKPVSQKKVHGGSDRNNEEKYPELYRKSEYVKGSNLDVPTPFQIG